MWLVRARFYPYRNPIYTNYTGYASCIESYLVPWCYCNINAVHNLFFYFNFFLDLFFLLSRARWLCLLRCSASCLVLHQLCPCQTAVNERTVLPPSSECIVRARTIVGAGMWRRSSARKWEKRVALPSSALQNPFFCSLHLITLPSAALFPVV